MTNTALTSLQLGAAIPPDNPHRELSVASSDDPKARHIGIAGNTYTILLSGEDTDGRYCLIDMNVPPGGGPPPHRHDFEEMFTLERFPKRLNRGFPCRREYDSSSLLGGGQHEWRSRTRRTCVGA